MEILLWKYCKGCKNWKLKSEFYKDKKNIDGLKGECKECVSNRTHEWHKANPEKRRKNRGEWKLKHPEAVREAKRKYAKTHPERRAANKRWRARNSKKVSQSERKWKQANRDKTNQYSKNHLARKMGNGGIVTAAELRWLKEFYNYTCLCCRRKEPQIKLEHDHVKPLSMGGENTIGNSQVLCRSCNASKGAKWIDYRPGLTLL